MKRVFSNLKGGVGKSSTAVNFSAISAQQGTPTLIIDMDPQGNTSRYLLGEAARDLTPNLADYFKKSLDFSFYPIPDKTYVHATPFENLFIIPSHPDISDMQGKLESRHKIYKLRDSLKELEKEFPEIVIDTPPAYNFFTQSALIAADTCLIPFDCDDFARQSLYTLLNNVKEIQADHNAKLVVEGIIVNQFQRQAKLPQRLIDELLAEGLPVLNTKLSSSIKMRESHDQNLPLIHMDPKHKLSQEFVEFYLEIQGT